MHPRRKCLLCNQVAEAESFGGGPLWSDEAVLAFHLAPNARFPRQYLGRIMVVTKRHVDHLSDLTEAETVAAALAARRVAHALRKMPGVERVHLALIGQHHAHFHLHVFPRYAGVPPEADRNTLYERDDAPRGGGPEIISFIESLRPWIPT